MNQATILAINQLNSNFYEITNPFLNHSDHVYRHGWDNLKNIIKSFELKLNMIDIGCGDGRFGSFLAQNNFNIDSYLGLDNSSFSLEIASKKISKTKILKSQFIKLDLIFDTSFEKIIPKEVNLIVIIGLFHHIPSQKLRLEFMKKITSQLTIGTKLIWTTYQYLDIPRLKRQVLDLEKSDIKEMLMSKFNLDINFLETGDSILEWKKILETKETIYAYRYSHYFSQTEISELIFNSDLSLISDFIENGNEGGVNRYLVCEKI